MRKIPRKLPPLLLIASLGPLAVACGDLAHLQGALPGVTSAASRALSTGDIVAGLKNALANGTESAINSLGRTDGFFGDSQVRIPIPESLERVDSALRALGQDRYVDEFQLTLNRAAERAVPEASAILGDAIRQITFDDARTILNGPDDAATEYFRKVGESRLFEKMLPLVRDATAKTGVTGTYKSLLARAGPAALLLGDNAVDIDQYVTGKTMDGLFLMIAAEEKRIREDPLARTTEILRRVFG